ncbi:MAG: sensor domain-containing diguanylate cyclase [Sulfurimonas sp.]|uniref:sensor domain-containing diguanylate cyclase n=1 Tax=Sulfurimonas sp. TaxID=2022749 RepID=UPI00261F3129|nr:sensor domain-containing diguanylate cyclase [Sulfurimonas sp.]MDD5372013.1 sensor domain-containing diguanylate cyclase [Sulfurimonas sp.]
MKLKCSFCTLWMPTLITSIITVLTFLVMYTFLHHSLSEMLQAHKHTQELTKKIERMVSSTLNATFLGSEEGFLEAVNISNQIHDDILLIEKNDMYNTASLFDSYEQLYKKLISAVSYNTENRLEDTKAALEAVKVYTDTLEGRMNELNEYFNKREKEAEYTLLAMMLFFGSLLLFIALFNGFYLIPRQVIRPLEEFAAALQENEEKYRIVANWTHDWEYWVGMDKNIIFVSPSVQRVTGYTQKEFMQNPSLLANIIYPEDIPIWQQHVYEAHLPNRPEEDAQEVEFRIVRKDGDIVYIDHICRPVYNYDGTYMGVRVANRDVTHKMAILAELKEKNHLLDTLATVDGLSGLYNRRYFNEVFAREIERTKRTGNILSIIMCDIDHFKLYNDTYGHQKGDAVIKQVSDALKSTFSRAIDIVARYGGEEFVILLPSTPPEEVKKLAEQARENVAKLWIEHSTSKAAPFVTMSFGAACCTPDISLSGDKLLKQADDALYESKEKGRNRVTVAEC